MRPKISVCMAVYNGERYIAEQLRSILDQLSADDEVIIVDDASTDGTLASVRRQMDQRLILIEENRNRGVAHTFETALKRASGEFIFLSDQDDLWEPNKVSVMLEAFMQHPDINLFLSDASIIDEKGRMVCSSYFKWRGAFADGLLTNITKSKYHGCVMAFRAVLLPDVMPFPEGRGVLHDIWIGCRNRLAGGRAMFIPDKLVKYRRHETNVTGVRHLTIVEQIRNRANLVAALVVFEWRRRAAGRAATRIEE